MRKHGGYRPGAGRKREGKKKIQFSLPPDVIEFLHDHKQKSGEDNSVIVERSLRALMRFEKEDEII